MTGSAAPKDPEKARPFFYILKDKDVFGERQKDGTGIQFIYESDGRLINSAQITGNVTDKEELTLLETVEGFGRLVHSIGVSVETDRPEETAEFVFQMYGKRTCTEVERILRLRLSVTAWNIESICRITGGQRMIMCRDRLKFCLQRRSGWEKSV